MTGLCTIWLVSRIHVDNISPGWHTRPTVVRCTCPFYTGRPERLCVLHRLHHRSNTGLHFTGATPERCIWTLVLRSNLVWTTNITGGIFMFSLFCCFFLQNWEVKLWLEGQWARSVKKKDALFSLHAPKTLQWKQGFVMPKYNLIGSN